MEPAPNQPDSEPSLVPTDPGQVFTPAGQVTLPPQQPEVANPTDRPTAVTSPVMPGSQTILPQVIPAESAISKPPRGAIFKKPIAAILVAFLLLAGTSAAAYFGYYIPNRPENIWSKALTNTGKGYDKLASYTEGQFGGKNKGIKLSGSYKLSGFIAADGVFAGSSDGDNGEFTASLSASGVKVNLDSRVIKSAAGSPDIYFKLDGVQGIGTLFSGAGSQYEKDLNGINGTWYFIDHTLFDQYATGANTSLQINQSDVKSVLKAVGDASKQNVFTSDPNKMAFVVKQNVGKEKQDGRSVYHFKAAIQKDNLKAYVNTLCANLKNSSLKKFFGGDSQSVGTALSCDNTSQAINNFKDGRTADVWVDMRTKLIHKVRITDANKTTNYFEVGQDYQGGDNFPFFMNFHSKDSGLTNEGNVTLTLNMKTSTLTVKGSAKDSGNDSMASSIDFSVSPNNAKVKVDKPANAKTLIELVNDLGLADIFGGEQTTANDTERKTDINALHGQIEAYDAQYGHYPTLGNLNDSAWRTVNMKGLDSQALKDPDGAAAKIAATPAAHAYSYQATPAGCDNLKTQCTDYTLTATLDSGGTYVKQALNFSDNTLQTNIN